jgi:hypothetical protein
VLGMMIYHTRNSIDRHQPVLLSYILIDEGFKLLDRVIRLT